MTIHVDSVRADYLAFEAGDPRRISGRRWSQEFIEEIRQLADHPDNSASVIGRKVGLSRNAIIGMCHRNGIKLLGPRLGAAAPKNESFIRLGDVAARAIAKIAPQPRLPRAPAKEAPPPVKIERETAPANFSGAERLFDATDREPLGALGAIAALRSFAGGGVNACRYPTGDPADDDFTFCYGMTRPGAVYCDGHQRLVWRATPKA